MIAGLFVFMISFPFVVGFLSSRGEGRLIVPFTPYARDHR